MQWAPCLEGLHQHLQGFANAHARSALCGKCAQVREYRHSNSSHGLEQDLWPLDNIGTSHPVA